MIVRKPRRASPTSTWLVFNFVIIKGWFGNVCNRKIYNQRNMN